MEFNSIFAKKQYLFSIIASEKNPKRMNEILQAYNNHPHKSGFLKSLSEDRKNIHLKALHTSASALFAASVINTSETRQIFIFPDKEKAAYFHNDLEKILPKKEILFFPSAYKRSTSYSQDAKIDTGGIILRTEVLNKINTKKNTTVVSYTEAVAEKVITKNKLETNTLEISKGEEIPVDFIVEVLIEYGFERVDFVYEPGQYAVRGSIVDIFSFSNDFPYRVDFFDDEIESIRTFEIVSQLSKAKFDKISIIPDIQSDEITENKISFFEFIPQETIIWASDIKYTIQKTELGFEKSEAENIISGKEMKTELKKFTFVEFSANNYFKPDTVLEFKIEKQLSFNKNFDLLTQTIISQEQNGYTTYILTENPSQAERLQAIFDSQEIQNKYEQSFDLRYKDLNKISEIGFNTIFKPIIGILHSGFIDHDLSTAFFTDHQIFGRYHKFKLKSASFHKSKEALTIREINDLQPGDYVLHSDHGIGRFGGLQTIENNGKTQEAIRLVYKDKDVLFVNIHNLHKISKYRGKDGTPPKIYKLGSGTWQALKKRTKNKVKDIAKELIALYAMRKRQKGFAFSADTYMQNALESSFIYEDTPDQSKTTEALKKDMESEMPMDRLVCGDVGFGKTEIAIRAAFKAVADSKQVAVLVPTTVLAMQHAKTFSDRLKEMPCTVDYINRFKTAKEQRETLKKLASGRIDILIGTHRIVSKDVKFKDLGLMIVDEEQKFGVSIKEKLKNIKVNVDTLTLTATPIPRTLQFSLMGARDLSIINTAPPNRYPIFTELHTFNEKIIKEAIEYEIERNGQVFFIHNRVQNIKEVEAMINRICPDVSTVVAHGQMRGKELEQIMIDFIDEQYGVLIATTIIESGLDIPNANTIIINNAQNFGLSDMHQLRGRVGRSNKKAFCYLLAPPIEHVSAESRRRLKAIETFSELGSGFNIAMQDLDIRGAGNVLGGEQSGFISDIGYETYHRILDEALLELRENEFRTTFENVENKNTPIDYKEHRFVTDCHLDTDLEIYFAESYIKNITERLKIYRELDKIEDEYNLKIFEKNLKDRFGKIPKQSMELINAVRLRKMAIVLGMEKIILKKQKLICHFISNKQSAFYNSKTFSSVIFFLQKHPKLAEMAEKDDKLRLVFENVDSVSKAIELLALIEQ